MRSTPYHHYALYEPDAFPDLTEQGEYNSAIMGIDADLHAEETERKSVDAELDAKLAAETKARTDADLALDAAYKAADTSLDIKLAVRSKFYLPRGEGFPSPLFFFMILCIHTRDFGSNLLYECIDNQK